MTSWNATYQGCPRSPTRAAERRGTGAVLDPPLLLGEREGAAVDELGGVALQAADRVGLRTYPPPPPSKGDGPAVQSTDRPTGPTPQACTAHRP